MNPIKYSLLFPFVALAAQAQLAVTVSQLKISGQKAVVPLVLKNNFTNRIESARAVCFLLDDQGKMVGQSTKWVVSKTSLEPKGEAKFNFVITSPQPFTTTNLTAKVSFNRVILADGKLADVAKQVTVSTPK
jgi:hypothetical protein